MNLLHGDRMHQIRQLYKVFISPSYYFHKPCSCDSERRYDMSVLKYTRKSLLYNLIVLILISGVVSFVYSQLQKDQPSVSVSASAVSPVSGSAVSSSISPSPRFTAPWMTTEELAALHLDAYYQVIVDANIFQPLQKRSRVKVNPYQLIGTLSQENETIAFIMNTFTRQVHRVVSGDWIDNNVSVVSVTKKNASLRDKRAVITELELGSMFLK